MRILLLFTATIIPLQISASCPELKYVVESIHDIREALAPHSEKTVIIHGVKYKARHESPGPAVDDLLAGNFNGYIIERLKETTPGECHYRIKDDRTPVHGTFILSEVR